LCANFASSDDISAATLWKFCYPVAFVSLASTGISRTPCVSVVNLK
jgi:hypothetical protein